MYNPLPEPPVRPFVALAAFCLMAICPHLLAQSAPAVSAHSSSQPLPAAKPNPNDEMLANAGKRYYSSTKDGLTGFDCPDASCLPEGAFPQPLKPGNGSQVREPFRVAKSHGQFFEEDDATPSLRAICS